MPRRTASYLNELKNDVNSVLEQIRDLTFDIEEAGSDLADLPAHDLVANDKEFKFYFDSLVKKNRDLNKLFSEFRKVRAKYLDFF